MRAGEKGEEGERERREMGRTNICYQSRKHSEEDCMKNDIEALVFSSALKFLHANHQFYLV